ncbi:TaqI-like C-terminal specificity domain-containing protein [Helicobacter sp. MIT 14-3879]|uniref:TaqI-like C-terminal specificity domain-containing protein n=1 Tax=Helicobacter sp. MIT 14-3879 TaxID=2040649 RepID=UPI000E1F7462|nr:hypothetical protein CQA44_05595 [Helicobacter sp. MIT 14-3879]
MQMFMRDSQFSYHSKTCLQGEETHHNNPSPNPLRNGGGRTENFLNGGGKQESPIYTHNKGKYQGKILYPCIMASEPCFVYEKNGFFAPAPANIITGKENEMKYLTGLLNSQCVYFAMRRFYMGGGIEGELKTNNLLKLPIPQITKSNQKIVDKIITLVDKILESKAKDSTTNTSKLESKIDILVYELYNLTNEEIKIIEGK